MLLEQATKLHLVFYGSKNLAGGHVIEVYESTVPKCRQYIGGLNALAAAASCLECAHWARVTLIWTQLETMAQL